MDLDNATVKVVLKTGKIWLNAKGEYPVKLRITHGGKQKFYTVKGESATKDEFTAIMNPKSKGERKSKREKFEAIEARAKNAIEDLKEFSFEAFEQKYLPQKQQNNSTIQDYFEDKAIALDKVNKRQTATLYRATIKSLEHFDKNISFKKITPTYLKKYEDWFVLEGKTPQKKGAEKKGGSYTTVGIYMRNLRYIINRAINNNVAIEYPFGKKDDDKYSIPDSNNKKKALTIQDIEKLFSYKPTDRNEYLALNYWLFSYLCNGMNMADVANLKFSNIKQDNIEFIRQKTKDTTKDKTFIKVLLTPEVQEIIDNLGNEQKPDNYIFPIYSIGDTEQVKFNRLKQHIKNTNKYIKRVAEKIGINENITTYWARHSYSTVLKRSGAPIEFIGEQLGHQDIKTTKSYLDSFEDEQRAMYSANLTNFKNNK